MRKFLSLFAAILFAGSMMATTPAAVGTTLFSENFGGYSANDVPNGKVSSVTGCRVIYADSSVIYTAADGGSTTKIYNENIGGGTAPEILISKSNGSLTIAGIPSGGAKEITVSYKQNKQKLKVEATTTGYTGSKEEKPAAVGTNSFDITVADGAAATFDLVFTCTGTSNVRVDDIVVTIKTAGESSGEEEEEEETTRTIYLNGGGSDLWNQANAVFFIHAWGGTEADVLMTLVEGDVYSAAIPSDNTSLLFVRMAPGSEAINWDTKWNQSTDQTIPADKDLFTMTDWSNGTWSVYGEGGDDPVEPTLANGFYLIGQNGWTVAALNADLKFAVHEGDEYVLTATLAENDPIKVVKVENDVIVGWYPDGEGTEYTVDAAHAGEKDIYFQEAYKADWAEFGGYFWMGENQPAPVADFTQPFTLKFNGTGTSGSDNSVAFAADVAAIFDAASAPYVASVETATKTYAGRPIADDNSSVKFGTTSAQGSLSFTLAQAIEVDSIIVNATQYGNNAAKVTINGTEFDLTAGNKVPQDSKITPEGAISVITIAQSGTERIYLRNVRVYPKTQGGEGGEGGDDPDPQPTTRTIYLNGGGSDLWNQANAVFFIHAWGGTEADVEMTLVEGDVYSAAIPSDNTSLVFVRMAPGSEAIDWEAKWNQSADQTIPADKDLFTMTDWSNGTWSVYGEEEFVGFDARTTSLADQIAAGLAKYKVNVAFTESSETGNYNISLVEGGKEGKFSFGGVVFAYTNSEATSIVWKTTNTYIQPNGKDREIRIPLEEGKQANVVLAEDFEGVLVNGEAMNLVAGSNILTATANGLVLKSVTTTGNQLRIQAILPIVETVFTVNVPEGTDSVFIAGTFNDWSFEKMAAVEGKDNQFTITKEILLEGLEYKYLAGPAWPYVEVRENNRTYAALDEVEAWTEVPDGQLLRKFPKGTTSFIGYEWGDDVAKNKAIYSADKTMMLFSGGNPLAVSSKGLQIGNTTRVSAFVFRVGETSDIEVNVERYNSDITIKLYYMGESTDVLTNDNLSVEGTLCDEAALSEASATATLKARRGAAGYYKVVSTLHFYAGAISVNEPAPNYYIIGAGEAFGNWSFVPVMQDTFEVKNLAAGDYMFRVAFENGNWDNTKGYSDLTEKAKGLSANDDNNILFTLEEEGDVQVVYNDTVFRVIGNFKIPCLDGPYSILVNGEDLIMTVQGEDFEDYKQYVAYLSLTKDDSIQLINESCGATWLPAIEEGGMSAHFKKGLNAATIDTTGCFDLYIKMKAGDDKLYIGAGICADDTIRYTVRGKGGILGEDFEKAIDSKKDTLDLALEAGDYKLKVVVGEEWKGFEQMSDTAANLEVDKDGNICFEIKEAGTVQVVYNDSVFKLIGNFAAHSDRYFVAGTMTNWKDEMVELLPLEPYDDVFSAMLNLEADSLYEFKAVRVHWNDTTWFGLGEWAKMEFGNCEDWNVYKSENEQNQANVGLQTTKEGEYPFLLMVAEDHLEVSVAIPARYYAKYSVGETWAWSMLTENEGLWIADSVIYRGGGANVYFKEDDEHAWYFNESGEEALKAIDAYEGFAALDTVQFRFNPADTTLAAILIGKYVEPTYAHADGYYLVGDFGGVAAWDIDDEKILVANTETEGEFLIENITLAVDDSLKIIHVVKDQIITWYPEDNNYVIDAAHAGEKTIFFNPAYQEAWGGHIFIEENPTPAQYGILLNGEFVPATLNEQYTGEGEEWVVETTMYTNDKFQIYDNANDVGWIIALDEFGYTNFDIDTEAKLYTVKANGTYNLCIKLIYGEDSLYVGFNAESGETDINNLDANAPAVKILRDGQILIIKGTKTFNIQGQLVR